MKKILFVLSALFAVTAVEAQKDAVARICAASQNDNRVMEHLDVLANRIGGRPVGSDSYRHASEWAADRFRSWGYEVTLEEAGQTAVGFNRGPWRGRMTGEENMTLNFVTPSYTAGTKGVQRGRVVIEPRSREEMERMRAQLRGAWVLVQGEGRGWPIDSSVEGDRKRAEDMAKDSLTAIKNRAIVRHNYETKSNDPLREYSTEPAIFYRRMVEAGALGFIQSAPLPLTALYDRETVWKGSFDSLPDVCNIQLDSRQYDKIRSMVKERRDVELEFDIRNHFFKGPVEFHNVVAVMRGSEFPDQYVVVGAHLDSHDAASGAVDDGNGSAVVMEAARMIALSGKAPRRTMIFILFAGEEYGLLGSVEWVKRHTDMLPRISNMFNRDGGPMPYTGISVPASLVSKYKKITAPLAALYPDFGFKVDTLRPAPRPDHRGGVDASSFAVEGVPTINPREGDINGYGFSYRDIWHTDRDNYNMVYADYMRQAAAALALIAYGTANLDSPLPREEVYTQ